MNAIQRLLAFIVFVELCIGGFLNWRRELPPPRPPVPQPLDSAQERKEFEELAAECESIEDWRKLSEIYLAFGHNHHAEACYAHLVTIDDHPATRFDWGFVLMRLGRLAESNKQFRAAIKQGHANPADCRYFIARNLQRAGKPQAAAAEYRKIGDVIYAHYELSRLHLRNGDYKSANTSIDRVLAQRPNDIIANNVKYRCELAFGHASQAAVYRDRSEYAQSRLKTPFDTQWLRMRRLRAKLGIGRWMKASHGQMQLRNVDRATQLVEKALAVRWNPIVARQHALLIRLRGDVARFVELMKIVIEKAGPSTPNLIVLADEYIQLKEPDRAVDALKQAAEVQTTEDLSPVYRKLVRLAPKGKRRTQYEALALLHAGRARLWNGKAPEAVRTLEQATGLDSTSRDIWFALAEARRLSGDQQGARAAYQKTLELDSNFGPAIRGQELLTKP